MVTYVELQERLAGGVKASVESLADLAAIRRKSSDDDMRLVTEAGIATALIFTPSMGT